MRPTLAEAHYCLANTLSTLGKQDDAISSYLRAVELRPDYVEVLNNLGVVLRGQGRLRDAEVCYRRVLELRPDSSEAHNNLGLVFKYLGELDEATLHYRRAIELKPDTAEAHCNLATALRDQGKVEEAVASYRRALELKPDYAFAHTALANVLYFTPGCSAAAIFEEHRKWNEKFAAPLGRIVQPHANDRSPNRRLKVGYVSPNFRDHCQTFFTLPLFSAHITSNSISIATRMLLNQTTLPRSCADLQTNGSILQNSLMSKSRSGYGRTRLTS